MKVDRVKKAVNKIEIFRPKRKFLKPVDPDYFIPKGECVQLNVAGIKIEIENTKQQNVYVRFK